MHKGKKVDLKTDTHSQRWERWLQENGLAWDLESYVTSWRQSAPLLAIWPVFHAPRASFDTQSVLVHFLPNRCLGSHVTWNSAVPDPNAVWCCILLFYCTLDKNKLRSAEIIKPSAKAFGILCLAGVRQREKMLVRCLSDNDAFSILFTAKTEPVLAYHLRIVKIIIIIIIKTTSQK